MYGRIDFPYFLFKLNFHIPSCFTLSQISFILLVSSTNMGNNSGKRATPPSIFPVTLFRFRVYIPTCQVKLIFVIYY